MPKKRLLIQGVGMTPKNSLVQGIGMVSTSSLACAGRNCKKLFVLMLLAALGLQPMTASARSSLSRTALPEGSLSQPVVMQGIAPVSDETLAQLMDEAERLYQQRHDAEALKLFSSLIELAPQHRLQAWLRVGNIHQRAGSAGAALEAYQHLLPAGAAGPGHQAGVGATGAVTDAVAGAAFNVGGQTDGRKIHGLPHQTTRHGASAFIREDARSGAAQQKPARRSRKDEAIEAARHIQDDAWRLKGMVNLTTLAIEQARLSLDQIEQLQRNSAVREAAGLDEATEVALVQTLRSQAAQIQRLLGNPGVAYPDHSVYSAQLPHVSTGSVTSMPASTRGRPAFIKPDIVIGHKPVAPAVSPVAAQGDGAAATSGTSGGGAVAASRTSGSGAAATPGDETRAASKRALKATPVPSRNRQALPVIEYQVGPLPDGVPGA